MIVPIRKSKSVEGQAVEELSEAIFIGLYRKAPRDEPKDEFALNGIREWLLDEKPEPKTVRHLMVEYCNSIPY